MCVLENELAQLIKESVVIFTAPYVQSGDAMFQPGGEHSLDEILGAFVGDIIAARYALNQRQFFDDCARMFLAIRLRVLLEGRHCVIHEIAEDLSEALLLNSVLQRPDMKVIAQEDLDDAIKLGVLGFSAAADALERLYSFAS
jgi:hypothetical protein